MDDPIQRYRWSHAGLIRDDNGTLAIAADAEAHEAAAVAAARAEGKCKFGSHAGCLSLNCEPFTEGYLQGQRDERAKWTARMDALMETAHWGLITREEAEAELRTIIDALAVIGAAQQDGGGHEG